MTGADWWDTGLIMGGQLLDVYKTRSLEPLPHMTSGPSDFEVQLYHTRVPELNVLGATTSLSLSH